MSIKKWSLVAGGAGFLGSHLCRKLLSEGKNVICVDNLYTGNKDKINDLIGKNNFKYFEKNIIEELFFEEKIDSIYNLACPASPIHYQHDPFFTIETNYLGTKNLLNLAITNSCKFLQASTSEVYGDPLEHPQNEMYWGNVNPIGIRSCYDEGKRIAETLCLTFKESHDLDVRICRIFNTYGPYMNSDDGRVVSNFIVQALSNESITVYGDGSQTRSFCYCDDLISGFFLLMDSESKLFGPYNLGNPLEFTVLELAEMIIDMTNSKSKIVFKDLPQDDPLKRRPDISKSYNDFGWKPVVKLNDGLASTINYFESVL